MWSDLTASHSRRSVRRRRHAHFPDATTRTPLIEQTATRACPSVLPAKHTPTQCCLSPPVCPSLARARAHAAQGEVSTLRLEDLDAGGLIGRGASSRVYRATHRPSGKRVALKVLQADIEDSRESRHMMLNEIKITFNACSDHLVTFYDAFYNNGAIYLALEYMDCGSLEHLLRVVARLPERVLPEAVLASILHQVLQVCVRVRVCVCVCACARVRECAHPHGCVPPLPSLVAADYRCRRLLPLPPLLPTYHRLR